MDLLLFRHRTKAIHLDAAVDPRHLVCAADSLPQSPVHERLGNENYIVTPVGGEAFEVSEKKPPPRRFLLMKGKPVNRMNDHGNSGKRCGKAADEPCFGVVRMDDVISFLPEVTGQGDGCL
jgi:hypothetical protein